MKKVTFSLLVLFFACRVVGQTLTILPQHPVICRGTSVVLTVPSSGSNYAWSPDTGLSVTTGDTVVASPTANEGSIIYTVTGLDSLGQAVTGHDTVTLIASPNKPIITLSATGDTLISSSTSDNQWYENGSSLNGSTQQDLIIASNMSASYFVTVTNLANGCSTASDTAHIITNSLSIFPQSQAVCSGTGIVLTIPDADSGVVYTWSPATGLSATTGTSVTASPSVNTTYTVTGFDSSGNSYYIYFIGSDTISITPAPNKPLIMKTNNGDSLLSSADNNNQWYENDSILNGSTGNVLIIAGKPNACYFTVVTNPANGCTATSDSICASTGYIVSIQPPNPTLCNGESITLSVPASGSDYTWSPSTGLSATTGNSVIADPTVTTTYVVTGIDSIGQPVAGQDIVTVLNGANKSAFITVHYDTLFSDDTSGNQWFRNDTLLSGSTGQFYVAQIDGWYYDIVSGLCHSVSDSIYIGAPGEYVWPGDANDDLTVNNNDLISIGLYYGDTGPARDTTDDNIWAPHPSTNWNSLQYCGIDKKYADCNGDGTINSDDTLAITQNYGLTHPSYSPPVSTRSLKGTVPLSIIADSASYHSGSMVHASVMLGNSATAATDIYGLAYTISIDNTIIEPGTLTFIYYDTSFLGTKNLDLLTLSHVGNNNVETTVTGFDHHNRTGYGKIGDLYFTLASGFASSQQALSISSYEAVDNAGIQKALLPVNDTVTVTTGINTLSINNGQLSIYPNPSNGIITISSDNNIDDITITNVLGQLIYKEEPGQKQLNVEIKNEGMYFITITSDNKTETQKIIITR